MNVKEIAPRLFIGAVGGIAIGCMVEVLVSYASGGVYIPGTPAFLDSFDNQLNAVLIERLVYAAMGAVQHAGGLVYKSERLSLLQATILHFAVIGTPLIIAATYLRWIPGTIPAFIGFICLVALIYGLIWLIVWFNTKNQLKEINAGLPRS
ncbi:DUF3021 domain-containing protein [Collinsella vaginalis]|uniref:DUF3021 domain-containing protein n=1 Tax=Collinsella vaginalis TaxID=1870987 RepID=UPI000A26D08D|nr:DUF3021 domain-containing protein [Collinsella vaginalis]